MKKIIQTCQIQMELILNKNKRELVILFTILAGMLLCHFIFGQDELFIHQLDTLAVSYFGEFQYHYYYTYYVTSIFRSFIILILCSHAITMTDSNRLIYGLSTFIAVSMGFDLISVISTDMHYVLKPYRYSLPYNFKDMYATFEITCLLYSGSKFGMDIIKSTIDKYSDRHSSLFDSFEIENSFKKKT